MSGPRVPKLQYLGRSEGAHAAKVQHQHKRKPPRSRYALPAQRIAAARNIAEALEPQAAQISPTTAPRILIDGLSLHQQRYAHTVYDRMRRHGVGPALVHRKPSSRR